MPRSEPAAQPYRKLTHNTKLSKAEAQFPSIVLTDLSHQNQGRRVVYLVFICIIPQRRCIFSNIADLDIFFLMNVPTWTMQSCSLIFTIVPGESACFDMWGKMIKLSGERSLWRQQVHNVHWFHCKRRDRLKHLKCRISTDVTTSSVCFPMLCVYFSSTLSY